MIVRFEVKSHKPKYEIIHTILNIALQHTGSHNAKIDMRAREWCTVYI